MGVGESLIDLQRRVPAIGDRCEAFVQARAQVVDERRQRVAKVLVFTLPESVTLHDDAAAEMAFIGIERCELLTGLPSQQSWQQRETVVHQVRFYRWPIETFQMSVHKGC